MYPRLQGYRLSTKRSPPNFERLFKLQSRSFWLSSRPLYFQWSDPALVLTEARSPRFVRLSVRLVSQRSVSTTCSYWSRDRQQLTRCRPRWFSNRLNSATWRIRRASPLDVPSHVAFTHFLITSASDPLRDLIVSQCRQDGSVRLLIKIGRFAAMLFTLSCWKNMKFTGISPLFLRQASRLQSLGWGTLMPLSPKIKWFGISTR